MGANKIRKRAGRYCFTFNGPSIPTRGNRWPDPPDSTILHAIVGVELEPPNQASPLFAEGPLRFPGSERAVMNERFALNGRSVVENVLFNVKKPPC